MEFKWILWSMTGVLAALFFISYFFNDKSKEKSRLEAIYYDLLFNHKNDPTKLEETKAAGQAYGEILGKDQAVIDKMVSKDLS